MEGFCGAENISFGPNDVEVEVTCDEEVGHDGDHIDNEQGYSWPRTEED